MEFIREGMQEGGCFLCRAGAGADDEACHVVARSGECFCLLNKYPYNNGHVLIAPYRHEASLEGLSEAEVSGLLALTVRAKQALDRVCAPHGFNVGINLGQIAGAGLEDHLHVHVVPRWSGDTNFVTTVGSTKVIPQALQEMWRLLTDAWEKTE